MRVKTAAPPRYARGDPLNAYVNRMLVMVRRERQRQWPVTVRHRLAHALAIQPIATISTRIEETTTMAVEKIEIKGLRDTVNRARKSIAEVRHAAAKLHEDTAALHETISQVSEHVNEVHADPKFEATELGNAPPDETETKTVNGAGE